MLHHLCHLFQRTEQIEKLEEKGQKVTRPKNFFTEQSLPRIDLGERDSGEDTGDGRGVGTLYA